jgi:hypothetical protein
MPAEGIHLTSLREAVASERLTPAARRLVVRHEDAARLGAVLLDLPYFDRYAEEVVRYVAHIAPRSSPYGGVIHERAAVPIALAMLERARAERSEALCAIGLGLVSHAAIDRQIHPLVNALARRRKPRDTHDASHREVEKFQSICFHEEYFGRDRMGTPGIVRLVAVPMRELFAQPFVADGIDSSFARALDPSPPRGVLRRMGRGYEQHALLLGSPIGKLVASEAEKAEARPQFLHGPWGTFDAVLKIAIARSVDVLSRAFDFFEATDADAPRAHGALRELLHDGTIDPQGDDVDLDVPFAVAPLAVATPALS